MNKTELATSIRHGLFGERETLKDAYDYSASIAESMGKDNLLVFTAIHVLLNTLANEIAKLEDVK